MNWHLSSFFLNKRGRGLAKLAKPKRFYPKKGFANNTDNATTKP
jgi:hypothetical protein